MRIYLILMLFLVGCAHGPVEDEKFTIKTYLQSTPSSTIIVVHGSGGVTSHEESWAQTLKSQGYNSVILDSYSMRGISSHPGVVRRDFTADDRAREIVKLANWVSLQSWHKGKIGLIGFSQGGSAVLAVASESRMMIMHKIQPSDIKKIDFAVLYYPGCQIVPPDRDPLFPIQLHLAGSDDLAQPWRCYLGTSNLKNYEVSSYENARHTFDWRRGDVFIDGRHFSFNKEANAISREQTQKFMHKWSSLKN